MPLATLAALLLLGREVEPERARAALAPLDLDRLAEAGVLATGDRAVRATLRVLPYEGLLLAFDPPTGEAGREEVTAPGPSAACSPR